MMNQTAIAPYEGKRPVIMKSGLVHWVNKETAEKLETHLAGQLAHSFIRINELNLTINSAEIDGVYTVDQYNDLCRIKQGEWRCSWMKWHGKKEVCECEKEARLAKMREEDRRQREERYNRPPLTREERERRREAMEKMNEEAVLNGSEFFLYLYAKENRSGRRIRRSTIQAWEEKNGPVAKVILERVAIHEDIEEAHRNEIDEVIT